MEPTPLINAEQYHLAPLLAAQNRTLDWLNTDDGDPFSKPNVARRNILQAANIVPLRYRAATPDHPDIRQWINTLTAEAFATQQKRHSPVASIGSGPSLLLLGPVGVGKTYQSYGALREMAVTGVAARWTVVTAADLYAQLQPRYGIDSETEFQRYAKAHVLLIDDLGAGGKLSEHTETVNFRLINYRYDHQLPTLITSNVPPKELGARMGDRVASRLVEMCDRITITGPDRRRSVAA
ncbi:ATP-binding protein [Streptomyces sp. NBC_01324]|uniref:ATP-binding protein n=1 Tax=Streptomyces sp. NBC_01324 TaxID=2903826 RepID=UPI002E152DB2|nr:ATP-binding protein [Streptomyces sp. NBC_01324]